MNFFRYSEAIPDIKERIYMVVYPALQGEFHNQEVNTPEFVE